MNPVAAEEVLKKEQKRSSRWRLFALFLTLLVLVSVADAFWIEPYWIEVTHHRVKARISSPLKIAHLTDLHTRGLGRREHKLLSLLEIEKPDLLVVTGDTVANHGTHEMCREVLRRLQAPLGVWLVRGNWELIRPIEDEDNFCKSVGVNFLLNGGKRLREDVWIVGFDEATKGQPDLEKALRTVPAEAFKIALFHSPLYFERVAGRCDLALAGHTHGGQVRLPFVQPIWLPKGCGRFIAGWYEEDGSRLYVSRGVGTSVLNVRFLCRPELAIIDVESEN